MERADTYTVRDAVRALLATIHSKAMVDTNGSLQVNIQEEASGEIRIDIHQDFKDTAPGTFRNDA